MKTRPGIEASGAPELLWFTAFGCIFHKMEWMKCSSCFSGPSIVSLSLGSCGHFICSTCYQKATGLQRNSQAKAGLSACLVCKKPCSLVSLAKEAKLSKDVQRYFSDPATGLKKLTQALDFQRKVYQSSVDLSQKQSPVEAEDGDSGDDEQLKIIHDALIDNGKQLSEVLQVLRQRAASLGIKLPTRNKSVISSNPLTPVRANLSLSTRRPNGGLTPIQTAPISSSRFQTHTTHSNRTTHVKKILTPSHGANNTTPVHRLPPQSCQRVAQTGTPLQGTLTVPLQPYISATPMPTEAHTIGQIRNPFI